MTKFTIEDHAYFSMLTTVGMACSVVVGKMSGDFKILDQTIEAFGLAVGYALSVLVIMLYREWLSHSYTQK